MGNPAQTTDFGPESSCESSEMDTEERKRISRLLEPGERERPTLKTIARIAGLAVPTVSRALHDAPDIGQDTKERVRELADELGYRPNRAGLRLRTGKTNVIALVLLTDMDVMNNTARLIGAIAGALRDTAYHLIVTPYFPDESPLEPVEYIVRTGSADGVILNRIQPNDPRVEFLRERRFPFALHGRTLNCGNEPYFDFDNAAFGRLCVEDLAARGRRNLLLVAPPLDQSYAQHMVAGAGEAAATAGVQIRVLDGATSDSPAAEVTRAVKSHLEQNPETDGLITASAPSAVAATLAVEDSGRMLGQEIDVASKEAVPFLKAFRKELRVVSEDVSQTGEFLAQAVMRAIDQPQLPPMQRLLVPSPIKCP